MEATLRAAATFAGVLIFIIGLGAFPYVYNYHLAPLARLAKQVHVNDSCAETAAKFADYAGRRLRTGNVDVQYADGTTDAVVGFNHYVPARRLLHLYDLGAMDDLQLTAICDPAGTKIEWLDYLGD